MTIGIGHDVLNLVDLDGRTFPRPLRLHVPIEDMRTLLRAADDRESTWQSVVDEIDRLATIIDTRAAMVAVTADGVVTQALSTPRRHRGSGLGWTAHAPESGQTYRP